MPRREGLCLITEVRTLSSWAASGARSDSTRATRTCVCGSDLWPYRGINPIQRPSKEAAATFYQFEEYRPYRQSRLQGARNEFLLVPGEDVAKLARIEA